MSLGLRNFIVVLFIVATSLLLKDRQNAITQIPQMTVITK